MAKVKQLDIYSIMKGPKGSSIMELDLTKAKIKKILKSFEHESFTVAELKYQEDGYKHRKAPYDLGNLVVGAILLRSIKKFVEQKNETC